MTDEKYTFIEDVREKKKTATGAYHKRTHCGKGGAIRFPSDFMTKKERDAMNGEVKSYKLNAPMSWAEFKAMPDDIKITYITALHNKFNVSDTKLAEMFGKHQTRVSAEMRRLGVSCGRRGANTVWDKDGWYAWVNGVKMEAKEEAGEVSVIEEKLEKCDEEVLEPVEKCEDKDGDVVITPVEGLHFHLEKPKEVKRIIPCRGSMTLKGRADDALETVKRVLGDADMTVTVYWCTDEAAGVVCDG